MSKKTKTAIKEREILIKSFLKKQQGCIYYCPAVNTVVKITSIGLKESIKHASLNDNSTLAVLNLPFIIKKAKRDKEVEIHSNNQRKSNFKKMLLLKYKCDLFGVVKLTLGIRRSGNMIYYCVTSMDI